MTHATTAFVRARKEAKSVGIGRTDYDWSSLSDFSDFFVFLHDLFNPGLQDAEQREWMRECVQTVK